MALAAEQLNALVTTRTPTTRQSRSLEAHQKALAAPIQCRQGSHHERWCGLFVPLRSDTGLAEVQCTWSGVFVAEAIAAAPNLAPLAV